jgi:hypothetical protein
LLAAVFSSCEPQSKDGTKTDTKYTSLACDIKVVTIDSCEYIVWGGSHGEIGYAHKGNCKFCAERSKK